MPSTPTVEQQASALLANASTTDAQAGAVQSANLKLKAFIDDFTLRSKGSIPAALTDVFRGMQVSMQNIITNLDKYSKDTSLFNRELSDTTEAKAAKIRGAFTTNK